MERLGQVSRIVLYGVGFIGGSLGLALRKHGYQGALWGIGRRAETLEKAVRHGAIDAYSLDPAVALAEAGLVVVGTPVDLVAETVARLVPFASPETVFTDVGSTKRNIIRACAERAMRARFVGGHPIAGSEKTGVGAARANLFEGAVCALTPTERTDANATSLVRELWETVGMTVVEMSPDVHDALLAASSHLPHVVAAALTQVVSRCERRGFRALDFTAGGFRDSTRIAAGSVEMWTPILLANAEAVVPLIRQLAEELEGVARSLSEHDALQLTQWLSSAKRMKHEADGTD